MKTRGTKFVPLVVSNEECMFNKLLLISMFSNLTFANDITITSNNAFDKLERSDVKNKIVIDLGKSLSSVDKKFYGAHLDSYSEIPEQKYFDDLKLGFLRVGGNEYDVFNWKNKQAITKNGLITLHGLEDVAVKLKKYSIDGVYQINLTGFQPEYEHGSFILKKTGDAKSAYDLVKYLNGKLNLKVVNFSLGNEFSIWHETHSHIFTSGDGISADEYINTYIQYAISIRKAAEELTGNANSIKIWGPEISSSWVDWNNGNFSEDCNWSDNFRGQVDCKFGKGQFDNFVPYFLSRLKNAESDKALNPRGYKLLDYFSFHYYPNFRTNINDINSIIKSSNGLQAVGQMLEATKIFNDPTYKNTIDISSYRNINPNILGRFKSWINKYYPNAKLALNEFAVDSDYKSIGYHPIIRPLYLADLIGILTKENVSVFNLFVFSNASGSQIPWSLVDGENKTNLYSIYKLYTNNFLGNIVNTDNNTNGIINSYALINTNQVILALVNKNPADQKVQIYLKDQNNVKKVITYLVPGWSANIIKFDKNSNLNTGIYQSQVFGAKEMNIEKDLRYSKQSANI